MMTRDCPDAWMDRAKLSSMFCDNVESFNAFQCCRLATALVLSDKGPVVLGKSRPVKCFVAAVLQEHRCGQVVL